MESRKPVYLMAGGRPRGRRTNTAMFQAIFRGCGKASPSIAYVGTANDDDADFFGFITREFKEAGAGRISHALIAPTDADLEKAQGILKAADVVFISGGDVERGMQVLAEKNMADFLLQLYRQGKPFFGASAGSIMLAKEWVRWRDPDDDTTAEIFPCLGIAPALCDTHAEDDDWQELKALLALEPDKSTGYGIPSGAAIKVFPDGQVEALGAPVSHYTRQHGKVEPQPDILPAGNL